MSDKITISFTYSKIYVKDYYFPTGITNIIDLFNNNPLRYTITNTKKDNLVSKLKFIFSRCNEVLYTDDEDFSEYFYEISRIRRRLWFISLEEEAFNQHGVKLKEYPEEKKSDY